jgi:putative photosynthetic complex assembly protein
LSSIDERPFPIIPVVAAGLVMLTTILGVKLHVARHPLNAPAAAVEMAPLQSRQLQFIDIGDGVSVYGGHVAVIDTATGAALPSLRDNEGFVRAVLNSLSFERTKRGVSGPPLFEIAAWPDQRITIKDLVSGATISVGQFGAGNKAAFLRFLPSAEAQSEAHR